MNRKLLVLITALSFPWSLAQADALGFEVGAGSWSQDADGEVDTDDLLNEVSFTEGDTATIIWAALEHPVPLLPNLRFATIPLEASNSAGDKLSLDQTDFTLYYELLDNWVNLDLGLTGRVVDGTVETSIEEDDVNGTVPMLYVRADFDMPITGLSLGGLVNTAGVYRDISLYVAYEFELGLGFQAGMRNIQIDFDEDDVSSSLENDGMYFAAYFHF